MKLVTIGREAQKKKSSSRRASIENKGANRFEMQEHERYDT
jgi:hypothetical protein